MSEYNDEMGLMHYAYQLATDKNRYSKEEIAQFLDQMENVVSEEAKQLGVDTLVKENHAKIKEYVEQLEGLDSEHNLAKHLENPTEYRFQEFLMRMKYFTAAKQKALERIRPLAKSENTITAISNLIEDNAAVIEQLNNEVSQIREEYVKRVEDFRTLLAKKNELDNKKDKSNEDLQERKRLTYLINERAAIEGTFNPFTDNSTSGYGVVVSPARQAKITPGTKDANAYQTGKQELALADLEAEINEPDLLGIAKKFRENVNTKNARSENVQAQVIERIQDELDKETASQNKADELSAAISLFAQLEEPVSTEDLKAEEPELMSKLIEEFKQRGVEFPDQVSGETMMEHGDVLTSILQSLQDEVANSENKSRLLEMEKARVQSVFETDAAKRAEKFENAENKEDFLVEEYFRDEV
jgi:hypothetical protein